MFNCLFSYLRCCLQPLSALPVCVGPLGHALAPPTKDRDLQGIYWCIRDPSQRLYLDRNVVLYAPSKINEGLSICKVKILDLQPHILLILK